MIRNIKIPWRDRSFRWTHLTTGPFGRSVVFLILFFYCGFEEPNKTQINLRAECASKPKSNKRETASGGVTGFRYSRIAFHLWRLFSFQPLPSANAMLRTSEFYFVPIFLLFHMRNETAYKIFLFLIITIAADPLTYWPKFLHCFDCAAHSWMPHSKNTTK